MRVNAELVVALRTAKYWSQEELSIASGLNLRTIQRIEKEAAASLQSKKALAAVFAIDIRELDYLEPPVVKKYEYKTINIEFGAGLFKRGIPDVAGVLNKEGADGWRLRQMILPETTGGGSERMVAILEREL